MKRLRNIRRFDDEARRTHGWLVQVQRKAHITIKMFSDGVHGGRRKALKAAVTYRKQVKTEVSAFDHQVWRRSILRRNNSSGISGVGRYDRRDHRRGGGQAYWLASWIDEHGAGRKRKFFILRHGERAAKRLPFDS